MTQARSSTSFISLLPFALFLALFLGTGIVLSLQGVEFAFYQLPASIAIIPAILLAVLIGKAPIEKQVGQFIQGAGHPNIITMCLIYLLAGAFASVAKATGSVDASVALGLSLFPDYLLLPGLFLVSAFIATAMGTSMGTIAAIAPIALGFSQSADLNAGLVAGCLLSGAIFGDNLSIISDTTIAATRSQGAQMRDKFKANFKIALPAALICLVLFALLTEPGASSQTTNSVAWLGLIPYITILVLALAGVNVFIVLLTGIVLAAAIGFIQQDYQLSRWVGDINQGFANMQDIFILSLLIGGLSELVKRQGGLTALTNTIESIAQRFSKNTKTSNSLGIAALAFCANFFTANNTVSIIISGDTAKNLADDAKLTPAQSASLLDIFACINQGLIPYGAQALLLGATMTISPIEVIGYSFYPMVLFVVALISFNKMIAAPKTQG
ncbi:Na+/H+ antiporter NhaC family protein [Endozoicomonas sp. G2_1]|uniref:Na+/H+ antiporter NhaC family protein n=1 Tax=Endozoicomonas sp. G2_1 TaxID=2821091 RepID=UPI001ADC6A19|nr:Na+/H+ antiporter NhaC family protein [Endozoicomonas sp. G2_1]MBO9490656.1 Na+/H+ antiporter NhaC family protein [Endozoicomonas sp. G2_1]